MNAQVLVKFQNQVQSILRPIFSLANQRVNQIRDEIRNAKAMQHLLDPAVCTVIEEMYELSEVSKRTDIEHNKVRSAMRDKHAKAMDALKAAQTKEWDEMHNTQAAISSKHSEKLNKLKEKLRLNGMELSSHNWREDLTNWRLDLMRKGFFNGYVPLWHYIGKGLPPRTKDDLPRIFSDYTVLNLTSRKASELGKEAGEAAGKLTEPITKAAEELKESMMLAWTADDTTELKASIRDINAKKRALLAIVASNNTQIAEVACDCPEINSK